MAQRLLNYEVLEKLGQGARSTIYLVQDGETGRKYALKHVKREDQKDIRFIEQMESEFEISRQLVIVERPVFLVHHCNQVYGINAGDGHLKAHMRWATRCAASGWSR